MFKQKYKKINSMFSGTHRKYVYQNLNNNWVGTLIEYVDTGLIYLLPYCRNFRFPQNKPNN